jgi:hypothetical protein
LASPPHSSQLQKTKRRAHWMRRIGRNIPVICPAVGLSTVPLGLERLVRLKILKNSVLN